MIKPIVLITGCTEGGIGYSLAKKFAQEGNQVVATARRIESLGDLDTFGCDKEALDISDQSSIDRIVQKTIEKYGRIDILVNNAGAPAIGALLDIDLETAQQCVNVNVFGTLAMCKAVAVHMAKNKYGKIVNIGSVVGYATTPWAGIYALSKAAVHSMSDTLRLELKPFGIQVTVVAPGAIKSNFGTNAVRDNVVPEGSLFTQVASYIIARGSMSQGPHSTSADDFSAHVVKRVSQSTAPRYITYGAMSWIFFLFYYLPFFIKDMIFYRRFGLNILEKNIK